LREFLEKKILGFAIHNCLGKMREYFLQGRKRNGGYFRKRAFCHKPAIRKKEMSDEKKTTDAERTSRVYEALKRRFSPPKFASVKEARIGTGHDGLSERRIDFLAVSAAKGNEVYAIEVKASRADFLKDIKSPQKQKAARAFANYFYYAAPVGIIMQEELPAWAGLIAVHDTGESYFAVEAPLQERQPPTWGFVAALIRNLDVSQRPTLNGEWVKPFRIREQDDPKNQRNFADFNWA
jgi:hypothetical protein